MLPLLTEQSTLNGVTPPPFDAPAAPDPISAGRFDWYAATILERPARLIATLAAQLGGSVVGCTPRHGYAEAVQVRDRDRVLCTVYHGGAFAWPHAFASSDETDEFVRVVRSQWPNDHSVTRMDAALDFDEPGAFERLAAICGRLAAGERVDGDERKRAAKVSTRTYTSTLGDLTGSTLYLGSPQSAVQSRLYEKGVELRHKAAAMGTPRDDVSLDLVRLEVQARPDGPARRRAAHATPYQVFGYAEWSKELLRRVLAADVDRVHIRERRLSDHERAMRWMVKQYRDHLVHAAELAGGWLELGIDLERRIMLAWRDEGAPDLLGDDGTPF